VIKSHQKREREKERKRDVVLFYQIEYEIRHDDEILAAFALPKSHLPRERALPTSFYTLCPALAPSSPSSTPPLHEPYLARAYL